MVMTAKTITFDFDNTIAMSHMDLSGPDVKIIFEEYNEEIISLIKKHIKAGDDVHIVTARDPEKEKLFPNDAILVHLDKLSLRGYFSDDRIHYTSDTPKLQTLQKLGSTLHYDDNMQEHIDNFDGIPVKNPYDFYPDTEHVVKVVLYDSKDNILLLKRTDKGEKWDIPGGHIKDIEVKRGESGFEEGLEREVAEETGLILPFSKQIGKFDFTFKGKSSKIAIYLSKIDSVEPEINLMLQDYMENSEYKWVPMSEMAEYTKNSTHVMREAIDLAEKYGILTEEERYQRAVKKKHRIMKSKLIGLGKNKHFGGGKGHSRPKMTRSKSAPPGFGAIGEEKKAKKPGIKIKITNNCGPKHQKKQ